MQGCVRALKAPNAASDGHAACALLFDASPDLGLTHSLAASLFLCRAGWRRHTTSVE